MRLMVILRSACCGIAVVVVSAPVGFSVLTWDAARRVPESVKASIGPGEALGFELGPLIREHPVGAGAWLVAAFAVGFFAGVARVFAEQFPADPVKKFSDARKWLVSAFIGT